MERVVLGIACALVLSACRSVEASGAPPRGLLVASLDRERTDERAFLRLAERFEGANPGYGLAYGPVSELERSDEPRLIVVQAGDGPVGVQRSATRVVREVEVGDLIFLRAKQAIFTEEAVYALVLTLPLALPDTLPTFVSPADVESKDSGWEDVRIDLVSWLPRPGAHVYQGISAKRVRVSDAPTHVHPEAGGFDELVVVLEAAPGTSVLSSSRTAAIRSQAVEHADVANLLEVTPLAAGDLVLVLRGTAHRPVGASTVLALAVPGFLPGAEVRLDDDLRAINETLGLEGDAALPVFEP